MEITPPRAPPRARVHRPIVDRASVEASPRLGDIHARVIGKTMSAQFASTAVVGYVAERDARGRERRGANVRGVDRCTERIARYGHDRVSGRRSPRAIAQGAREDVLW